MGYSLYRSTSIQLASEFYPSFIQRILQHMNVYINSVYISHCDQFNDILPGFHRKHVPTKQILSKHLDFVGCVFVIELRFSCLRFFR